MIKLSSRCIAQIAIVLFATFPHIAPAQTCCIVPTGETSVALSPYLVPTVTPFQMTLIVPGGYNVDGYIVSEETVSPGVNGCYYTGAPFPPTSSITGGTWTVGGTDVSDPAANGVNQWGVDLDGDSGTLIATIREHAVLPCTDHVPQTMLTNSNCNAVSTDPYYYNVQTVTITSTNVTNCRGGVCQTISL